MINLYVVCKNNLFYRNLSPILSSYDIEISTICTCPEETVDHYLEVRPDIVLMDFNWSRKDFSGSQLIASLLACDPLSKVIFATSHFEERICSFSKEIGAVGYLYRNVEELKALIECIRTVNAGGRVYMQQQGPNALLLN